MLTTATSPDVVIAAAIAAGRGIATIDDIAGAGIDRRSVRLRVNDGRLLEVFPGVVSFPQDAMYPSTRRRAAVLSCGRGALLGGWSAAEQWQLITFQTRDEDRPRVIVPGDRRPRRDTISVERRTTLAVQDVTVRRGIPCLSVPALLLDLARTESARFVQRLADEAWYRQVWDQRAVEALLERSHGSPGIVTLRAGLDGHVLGSTRTTNNLEEAFLAIADARGWPRPVCQVPDTLPDGRPIAHDFLWRDLGLAAETDGGRGHAGTRRQERDRDRDEQLALMGIVVIRARWDEVLFDKQVVIDRVEPELVARGWR